MLFCANGVKFFPYTFVKLDKINLKDFETIIFNCLLCLSLPFLSFLSLPSLMSGKFGFLLRLGISWLTNITSSNCGCYRAEMPIFLMLLLINMAYGR